MIRIGNVCVKRDSVLGFRLLTETRRVTVSTGSWLSGGKSVEEVHWVVEVVFKCAIADNETPARRPSARSGYHGSVCGAHVAPTLAEALAFVGPFATQFGMQRLGSVFLQRGMATLAFFYESDNLVGSSSIGSYTPIPSWTYSFETGSGWIASMDYNNVDAAEDDWKLAKAALVGTTLLDIGRVCIPPDRVMGFIAESGYDEDDTLWHIKVMCMDSEERGKPGAKYRARAFNTQAEALDYAQPHATDLKFQRLGAAFFPPGTVTQAKMRSSNGKKEPAWYITLHTFPGWTCETKYYDQSSVQTEFTAICKMLTADTTSAAAQ